jgi:adenylate kinase family enzyme
LCTSTLAAASVHRSATIPDPMRRVNVVGTSAAGKSTFARALAERLGVPCIELDALYWGPNWTKAPDTLMRERVRGAITGDAWVVDGNYSAVRDLVWERADTVAWLDYPLGTILWRYAIRTRRRFQTREEIWPGTDNRERLSMHILHRDGLLWWILSTYHRRRRDYPRLLAEHPWIEAVRLHSPREAQNWLRDVAPQT